MPPIDVFISYSHKDEHLREALGTQLVMLRRQGIINDWHDRKLEAGDDWKARIHEKLESAPVFLALISPDFLASTYCYEIEMTRALDRHAEGQARIIPIILRPCEWEQSPLARLQALPSRGEPVTKWRDADEAWLDVVKGIRRAIESLTRAPAPRVEAAATLKPALASLRLPEVRVLLDRHLQWKDVVDRSAFDGHQLFLLHGPEGQSLEAFTRRVRDYLEDHDVHVVSADSDGRDLPTTPTMWEERLVKTLAPGRRGRASDVLREAAEGRSLFLVFGREPLRPRLLSPALLEALEAFLRGRLAEIVREAAPSMPLRLYLAIEEPDNGPWHTRFDAALEVLSSIVAATYWGKRAVTFPEWPDLRRFVDEYLRGRAGAAVPDDWMARLKATYDHHAGGARHFGELCSDIDGLLRQLPGGTP